MSALAAAIAFAADFEQQISPRGWFIARTWPDARDPGKSLRLQRYAWADGTYH
jgi:hypothetical protein